MNFFKESLLPVILITLLIISGCQNNTGPEPNSDALFHEFSISELPNADFSINQEGGLIKVLNTESIEPGTDLSSLTATFSTSEGATVFVDMVEQVSGETVSDFSEGVFYTVVSEDESNQQSYFVYLSEELPPKLPVS